MNQLQCLHCLLKAQHTTSKPCIKAHDFNDHDGCNLKLLLLLATHVSTCELLRCKFSMRVPKMAQQQAAQAKPESRRRQATPPARTAPVSAVGVPLLAHAALLP